MAGQLCCYGFTLRNACITMGVVFASFHLYLLAIGCSWFIVTVGIISNGLIIFGTVKKERWYLMPAIVLHALANIGESVVLFVALYASAVMHAAISEVTGKDLPPTILDQMNQKGLDINSVQEHVDSVLALFLFFLVLFAIAHILVTMILIGHFNELRGEAQREEHIYRLPLNSYSFYPNLPLTPGLIQVGNEPSTMQSCSFSEE